MNRRNVESAPSVHTEHIRHDEQASELAHAQIQREQAMHSAFEALRARLSKVPGFVFGEEQQHRLRRKLDKYFSMHESIDLNNLFDAIVETPSYIQTDRGTLRRLLEVHEQKTLQKIAEIRRRRVEMSGDARFNPWENLIQTDSGNYYVARLLNMPHLQEDSEYMRHCVGTSDSYVNRMKRGEIEIWSFRTVPRFNSSTKRLEGDTPVITIEYNHKTQVIEQIRKQDDQHLSSDDPFYQDVISALMQLRRTQTDLGKLRNFSKVADSELSAIKVKDYHVLTEHGEMEFRDFDPDNNTFVWKSGNMKLTPDMSKADVAKIIRIVAGIKCEPHEIAFNKEDITDSTKVYIGEFSMDVLRSDIEHVYVSFPERENLRAQVEIGGKTREQLELAVQAAGVYITHAAQQMLDSKDFITARDTEKLNCVLLTVADLGFSSYPTIDQLYKRAGELGLELLPAEFGLHYWLQDLVQWKDHEFNIGMRPIDISMSGTRIFSVGYEEGEPLLSRAWALPRTLLGTNSKFAFRFRKNSS